MRHVDEGELHAYIDGAIDAFGPGELESLERHLAECESCRARLEVEREIWARAGALMEIGPDAGPTELPAYEDVVHDSRPQPVRRVGRGWLVLPWAATVVLALGVGWLARANDGAERDAALALESADAGAAPGVRVPSAESTALGEAGTVRSSGRIVQDELQSSRVSERAGSAESPDAAPAVTSAPAAPAVQEAPADVFSPEAPRLGAARSVPPTAPVIRDLPTTGAPTTAEESGAVARRVESGSSDRSVVIRGVVTEQAGHPLAGATVQVEGSPIGVITRADGSYSLAVPQSLLDSADTRNLRVAMVGYHVDRRRLDSVVHQVDEQNFSLQPAAIHLEGLVVAGYGATPRALASGIDRRTARRLLGAELPVIPNVPVIAIDQVTNDGENLVVVRQRLESGTTVELEVGAPDRREPAVRDLAEQRVEEIGARESADGAEIELRVRGMTVTITAPMPLAELRRIASGIR